ncbi:MAG TPA: sialidase family protein [Opitutus sp.]|nr:sialidase family protein [Opitutus sp.]
MKTLLPLLLLVSSHLPAAAAPAWAGVAPDGAPARIAVAPTDNPRFQHLAWPKAVRTADGTLVLGYQIGTHHGDGSCPAISISTDNGKTFSPPNVLREFGPGLDYTNSGNMAIGLAHDGAVIVLAHGHTKDRNHIFGWRSVDSGRTWKPVDTSALGPNKTGSSTGAIVQLPDRRLIAVGHYRDGSKPHTRGIWRSISPDDGLTWGEPAMVSNVNAGEPVIVRHEQRLLVFIRGRGPATVRQYIAVSDDFGKTWRTELSNLTPRHAHTTLITHPFAMVDPHDPTKLLAATIERPLPSVATLWQGDPQSLAFKPLRTLVALPKLEGDPHTDFGYPWLVHLGEKQWLLFYYHGRARGDCAIWVSEFEY